MLKIDFSLFIGIYIFIFIGIFAFFGLRSFLNQRGSLFKKNGESVVSKECVECNICTYVYETDQKNDLLICPRCKSFVRPA